MFGVCFSIQARYRHIGLKLPNITHIIQDNGCFNDFWKNCLHPEGSGQEPFFDKIYCTISSVHNIPLLFCTFVGQNILYNNFQYSTLQYKLTW